MKQKLLSVMMFACMLCYPVSSKCQDDKTELMQAVNILKGLDDSQSKDWAVERLESYLDTDRDAYALNVLGIAYLHGVGAEADTTKAVAYLEESGANGYKQAYHNLGMYYKYLPKEKQDFKKAFECFMKGAEANSFSCMYDAGYMLYKGLGCEQDYSRSVELFQKAVSSNHVGALFMLGLCYANGYGVERDKERGDFFLNQAATLDYRDAMEELLHDTPENDPKRRYAHIEECVDVPDEMPAIEPFAPIFKNDIAGKYTGALVTYDWSGAHIISEKPLTVSFKEDKGMLSGTWIQENDTLSFRATLTDEGVLKFDSTDVYVFNRYAQNGLEHYSFESADICCENSSLIGSLRMYSIEQGEPERPMYLTLSKDVNDSEDNQKDLHISAYPIAGTGNVTVKVLLDEDVQDAKICFYDRYGLNKQNFSLGSLTSGEHSFTLSSNLPSGVYLVRAVVGANTYGTIIKIER